MRNYRRANHRANRRVANADHAEAVDFVFSSFDKDIKEFGWWYIYDYGKLYADVEKILSRGFTGGPFDIDKIIDDVINGRSRFFKPRVSRKTANRPNEQQKKDFINPAREFTSVDYGELHNGSYYMSFGLGGVPNAIMVRIGDDELERVLEGLGHYYSFSADGYSFYLSYDNWEIWDHNGNGGFTISVEAMNVVHDGLFEIFLNDGMPHTSSRRTAYYDDYPDPLINQGPTYPDYSHPDLNEWDYSTRDKVLSIIKDNPEVENEIRDVLQSGGNPRDVQNIFEDYFGWEGVAYDMLGEDWLSVADRYR